MLSARRAARLKPHLDRLLERRELLARRLEEDPVRFPRRYRASPLDAELVGLVSACLAYGKAANFCRVLESLFAAMSPSPARFAQAFDPSRDMGRIPDGYRFNTRGDIAALVAAAGTLQRRHGSLGIAFVRYAGGDSLLGGLEPFLAELRGAIDPELERYAPGGFRALGHLLPSPSSGSACKRWMLFLRWMLRGGPEDPIDPGTWRPLAPAATARLIVPLDTHVLRIGERLGLTARRDASMRTALEVTASLARLDPVDPVKYDFALCHLGMSGACPAVLAPNHCATCPLAPECRIGARNARR